MKARIFIADHAVINDNGSFSVLNGGIDRFKTLEGQEFYIDATLVCMITASPHESGQNNFRLTAINQDGKHIASPIEGNFQVPEEGGKTQFVMNFELNIEDPGKYEFGILINDKIKDRYSFLTSYVEEDENGNN